MALCHTHDVTVISGEIWADLLLPGETFTSVLHLDKKYRERAIAATSASKTFGLSSLRISNFLIPNARLRQAFVDRLNAHGLDVFNALSMTAATAAYQRGAVWLDELLGYLAENRRWFERALAAAALSTMTQAEGTYLAWLDCRALGLSDADFTAGAGSGGKAGSVDGQRFRPAGRFYPHQPGCPRRYLERAVDGLARLK